MDVQQHILQKVRSFNLSGIMLGCRYARTCRMVCLLTAVRLTSSVAEGTSPQQTKVGKGKKQVSLTLAKGALQHVPLATTKSQKVRSSSHETLEPCNEDYRALVLDLLLYRRETLQPVFEALQKERQALDVQLESLDAKIAELVSIREDIHTMLRDAEQQRQEQLAVILEHSFAVDKEKIQEVTEEITL